MKSRIPEILSFIYGPEIGAGITGEALKLLEDAKPRIEARAYSFNKGTCGSLPLDETDAFVITYGDQMRKPGEPPLSGLYSFFRNRCAGFVKGIHILPFFPYSSDDGFSVIDYMQVNPELGTWRDIRELSSSFRLMADLVVNHCSVKSGWFSGFRAGRSPFTNYFITVPPDTDTSMVVRPRTHPLLTPFDTVSGRKYVWTTFSSDQADLNFAAPAVLLEMIRILLYYAGEGVSVFRIDAVPYLWKELGTPCIHHPKTHGIVKLIRAVLSEAAPWAVVVTESNVPHKENLSYFGDGDEAHMVYQFSLPPLTLDAFLRGDASRLTEWAETLPPPDGKTTFFNFLASHDGIGLLPAQGFLSEAEIAGMIDVVVRRGGLVSYKSTPDGDIPYEMNVNYLSAIADPENDVPVRARRFLSSQAVMLMMPGVPGVYIHSLLGSENWREGVEKTGMNRTINREKFTLDALTAELADAGSIRSAVFKGYANMLARRAGEKAFHPGASAEILRPVDAESRRVFGIRRFTDSPDEELYCLVNVSGERTAYRFSGTQPSPGAGWKDILTGDPFVPGKDRLLPWDTRWVKKAAP